MPLKEAAGHPGGGARELERDLAILWERRWLVAATVALAIGAAAAVTVLQIPVYTATAKVLVKPTGVDLSQVGPAGVDRLVSLPTEAEIVRSSDVAAIAARQGGLGPSPAALLDQVAVEVPTGAQVLEIRYSDPNPERARQGALAFAEAYLRFKEDQAVSALSEQIAAYEARIEEAQNRIRELERSGDPQASGQIRQLQGEVTLLRIRISDVTGLNTDPGSVVSRPELPRTPSSPNRELNLGLGLFAGVFAGVGIALLRARVDPRVRSRWALEQALGAPVLAIVPHVRILREARSPVVVALREPHSPASEAFRSLRTALLAARAEHGLQAVMVTSATDEEGKTTTAVNLATVLAQAGQRVLLVSADLRRPNAHEYFGLPRWPGLTDALAGDIAWQEAIQAAPDVPGLAVLAAGAGAERPAEVLQSPEMERFLQEQRGLQDFLVLDCPPLLLVADALGLARMVDGVLFVADARSTTRAAIAEARMRLAQMHAPLTGGVLNGFRPSRGYGYGYGYAHAYAPLAAATGDGSRPWTVVPLAGEAIGPGGGPPST